MNISPFNLVRFCVGAMESCAISDADQCLLRFSVCASFSSFARVFEALCFGSLHCLLLSIHFVECKAQTLKNCLFVDSSESRSFGLSLYPLISSGHCDDKLMVDGFCCDSCLSQAGVYGSCATLALLLLYFRLGSPTHNVGGFCSCNLT